uniref:substrate-binding domain-containing protein n=1 Tax=Eubacterium cellulosolvens TaxID=29322 RepID=UPI0004810E0E|nr:substrate-binding domain-containing protein [[Eubacterium] cellulosolvens]
MKKKVLVSFISAAMAAALLTGCGGTGSSTASSRDTEKTESTESIAVESTSGTDVSGGSEDGFEEEAASELPAQFEGLTADSAYDFPVIVKSFQSTYWQAALQGMDKAASELGVTFKAQGPEAESDIADQINMLNKSISSRPSGIALASCDTTSVIPSLQDCADQKIPVVAFDTGVAEAPDGSIVCTIATDNGAAGATAADHMYEAIKDVIAGSDHTVRIGVINQDATALNIQQRGLGFINEMVKLIQGDGKTVCVEGHEFYVTAAEGADQGKTDVVIEVAVPAQTTVELSATEAQTILSKEDTIAIFGSNQITAEGVLAANDTLAVLGSDAENGDVIGVGFDAGSKIKAAVEDGTFYGAVTQSPLMMGYYTIYALTAAANGATLEDVPTNGYWYDAENMNDDTIAPNLYD